MVRKIGLMDRPVAPSLSLSLFPVCVCVCVCVCVSSVFFQLGVPDPGSGVDDGRDASGGGERVFRQLPALRIHADAAGRHVRTTTGGGRN